MRELALRENVRPGWTLSEAGKSAAKTMGKTKSGKPIPMAHQLQKSFDDWDANDHEDAAEAHEAAIKTDIPTNKAMHKASAEFHRAQAKSLQHMVNKLGLAGKKKESKATWRHKMGDDHDFDESVVSEMKELLGEHSVSNSEVSTLLKATALKVAHEELNSVMSKKIIKVFGKLNGGSIQPIGMAKKLGYSTDDLSWVMDQLVKDGRLTKDGDGYYTMKENTDVANTIAAQMGGIGKIRMMLGAKQVMAIDNGLAIKWPNKDSSKGNYVEIKLDPSDTYNMEFFWVRGTAGKKSLKKFTMVYAEDLKRIFRDWTGWALSL